MSSSDIYESEFIVIPFGVVDNNPFQHIQQLQTDCTTSVVGSDGRLFSKLG